VFELHHVYAALDAERERRGITWPQVLREINAPFEHTSSRPISRSTVVGMRIKPVAEGDGTLQMLRWLQRSPESLVRGEVSDVQLPVLQPHQILRFDTRRLHAALDERRRERGLTWQEVARDMGGPIAPSSLMHLSKGGRTGFPHVMWMVRWLGRATTAFMRATRR
jgi:hypothetical protein